MAQDARHSALRFEQVLNFVRDGVVVTDERGKIVYRNDAAVKLFESKLAIGTNFFAVLGKADEHFVEQDNQSVLVNGESLLVERSLISFKEARQEIVYRVQSTIRSGVPDGGLQGPNIIGQTNPYLGDFVHDLNNVLTTLAASLEMIGHNGVSSESGQRYMAAALASVNKGQVLTRSLDVTIGDEQMSTETISLLDLFDKLKARLCDIPIPMNYQLVVDCGVDHVVEVRSELLTVALAELVKRLLTSRVETATLSVVVNESIMDSERNVSIVVQEFGETTHRNDLEHEGDGEPLPNKSGDDVRSIIASAVSLVELSGAKAKILASSELGTTVSIPLGVLSSATQAALTTDNKLSEGSVKASESMLNVLILDDELPLATTFGSILSVLGYAPHCIGSKSELLVELKGQQYYDLAFCDVGLPDSTPEEISALLKSKCSAIVYISGLISTETRKRLDLLHPFDILEKPFSIDTFRRTIDRFVVESG